MSESIEEHLEEPTPPQVQRRVRRMQPKQVTEFNVNTSATHVAKLFLPITLTMIHVLICIKWVPYYYDIKSSGQQQLVYTPFREEDDQSFWQLMFVIIGNSIVMLIYIIAVTCVIIFLYKKKFYKCVNTFLFTNSLMLMTVFMYFHFQEIFKTIGIPVDILSMFVLILNLCVGGIISIHFKGPMIVQNGYHIFVSSILALTLLKFLPNWSVWGILVMMSLWDLVAVLHKRGPLRILVETAQERNEPIFASLIYTATMAYQTINGLSTISEETTSFQSSSVNGQEGGRQEGGGSNNRQENAESMRQDQGTSSVRIAPSRVVNTSVEAVGKNRSSNTQIVYGDPEASIPLDGINPQEVETEQNPGIRIGLGDFIFYSLLVAKSASFNDWTVVTIAYISILVGLSMTLTLLAVFQKALPALPISILLSLMMVLISVIFISPFINQLTVFV
uniref:Presenilin n=1 Tax=Rhabditophanes sp. KR3021 TaxID=114890 RepID=A0AC35U115_9BILA